MRAKLHIRAAYVSAILSQYNPVTRAGNSDPETLKAMAEDDTAHADLHEQRQRIQSLMRDMNEWPTEEEHMTFLLQTAGNCSNSLLQRAAALSDLQVIVEHIDHANDLPKLGGVPVLVAALREGGPVQLAALKVLATAASNNVPLQKAILSEEKAIVPWLLQVRTGHPEVGVCSRATVAMKVERRVCADCRAVNGQQLIISIASISR
jgi:Nucleotide exchange factor Fes1